MEWIRCYYRAGLINDLAYWPIGRYRRSKHRKSMTSLNCWRCAATTTNSCPRLIFHHFCADRAPITAVNGRTVNGVLWRWFRVFREVRNADSGRYADALSGQSQTGDTHAGTVWRTVVRTCTCRAGCLASCVCLYCRHSAADSETRS